jgi:hypothetical protein
MQIFFLCFFIIAVICVILGFRKSSFGSVAKHKQHCAVCGWTKEKVQLCILEQHHETTVTALCFDCSLKYDAVPLRDASDDTTFTAWA